MMNKEEATKQANQINSGEPDAFCPLINNTCRDDCVCWKHAHVFKSGECEYIVDGGYCSNGMFESRHE